MAKSYAVFVLLFLILQPVVSRSTIKSLPGFKGRLPFELETGYVGVDESEDAQLFYYFIESEKNPKEDPLMIWLTGGPGCSSASALFYEIDPKIFLLFASCVLQPSLFVGLGIGIYIYKVRSDNLTELSDETNGDSVYQYDQKAGPLTFKLEEYNGSLPTLISVSYSWTKAASIIFLDSPVGSGFSYARTAFASQASDSKQVLQVDQFLRKWLMDHPQFLSNPFYVGGDSYSGIIVPAVVQQIQNRNEQGVGPPINLQGYLLGNPATNERSDTNYRIPFAHGMGLISDELYESLERNCGGEYFNVDPSHSRCLKDLEAYDKCVSGLNVMHILLAECGPDFAEQQVMRFEEGRYLRKTLGLGLSLPWFGCYTYPLLLSTYWANDENVRRALHVRKASIGKWLRCNTDNIPYTEDIPTSFQYHVNNSAKGLRSLIYSGDHDLMVPFLGTQAWIRALNYSIIDDWRPWMINDQIAGYTRTYANQMTFATIKGGAHTANYKPEECSVMFKRWINGEPL